MLIIVSDLHLVDGASGTPITAGAFKLFTDLIKEQNFIPCQVLSYVSFFKDDQRGGRRFEAWPGSFSE